MDLGRSIPSPRVILAALHGLSSFYEKKNPAKALVYLNEYVELNDSIASVEVKNKINKREQLYQIEKKDLAIELLETEKELLEKEQLAYNAESDRKNAVIQKNNIFMVALIVIIVIMSALGYFLVRSFRLKKLAAEAEAEKIEIKYQRKLDQLRNSIKSNLEVQPVNEEVPIKMDHKVLNDHLVNKLSEREIDVLFLVAEGISNNKIADQLFISVNTVKTHLLQIYEKLDVNNRTQAAVKATKLNLMQNEVQ